MDSAPPQSHSASNIDEERNPLCQSCRAAILSTMSNFNLPSSTTRTEIRRDGNGNLVQVQLGPPSLTETQREREGMDGVQESNARLLRRFREDGMEEQSRNADGDGDQEMSDGSQASNQYGIRGGEPSTSIQQSTASGPPHDQVFETMMGIDLDRNGEPIGGGGPGRMGEGVAERIASQWNLNGRTIHPRLINRYNRSSNLYSSSNTNQTGGGQELNSYPTGSTPFPTSSTQVETAVTLASAVAAQTSNGISSSEANRDLDADFPPLTRDPNAPSSPTRPGTRTGTSSSPVSRTTSYFNPASSNSPSVSPTRNRRESFSRSQSSPNSSLNGISNLAGGNGIGNGIEVGIPSSQGRGIGGTHQGQEISAGRFTNSSVPVVSFPSPHSIFNLSGISRSRDGSSNSAASLAHQSHESTAKSASQPATISSSTPSSSFGPQNMTRRRISETINSSTGSINFNRKLRSGDPRKNESRSEVIPSPFQRPYNLSMVQSSSSSNPSLNSNSNFNPRSLSQQSTTSFFIPFLPDPLIDTPLLPSTRINSSRLGSLFPGSIFHGTQTSGRSSYDVTVKIVNVDLENSSLCGYLNIRGLTQDWPELTTFFDAEIIGDRYGFITDKGRGKGNEWGSTEAGDLKHWVSD